MLRRLLRPGSLLGGLIGLLFIAAIFFFYDAQQMIGKPFPGMLTFQNGMVGAFGSTEWQGAKAGLRYHDLVLSEHRDEGIMHAYQVRRGHALRQVSLSLETFSRQDFLLTFFLPFATGIAYLCLAIMMLFAGRELRGIVPLIAFHLGIAYYLLASFDFHTGHHASWLFLLNFVLFPACMSHYAIISQGVGMRRRRSRILPLLPYAISGAIAVPYLLTFYRSPIAWILWERVVVSYAIISYGFWLLMLMQGARLAPRRVDRLQASSMLGGQLLAFLIPLTAAIAIFLFDQDIPLNWVAPITVVLPIATLIGILLSRMRMARMQLVQSAKMASLGSLVSGVAHEINNPVTFIASNLPMLREYVGYLCEQLPADGKPFRGQLQAKEVAEDLRELVETMADGAERITSIVSDLRRFGREQQGALEEVEIVAGVRSTLHLLEHRLKEGVQVQLQIPEKLSVMAHGGELCQIWMNLLTNALDALRGEGTIWISAEQQGHEVCISIRDDGEGVAPEHLLQIFDPFFTTKPEGRGTGLGLAICQGIVQRIGGRLEIDSEQGRGTTVMVYVPARGERIRP